MTERSAPGTHGIGHRLHESGKTMKRSSRPLRRTTGALLRSALALPLIWAITPCAAASMESSEVVTKFVSFAILEDYDKGDDLEDIARDFELMQELEVTTMRCSFGWDDYEPTRGAYDFEWLEEFVQAAETHAIELRPYIGYTPEWAGVPRGEDEVVWNNPPASMDDWYQFVFRLTSALSDHSNVLSYEIYNEENVSFWWDGSVEHYKETLETGSEAVRAGHPDAQVILGGMVYPDIEWLESIAESGGSDFYAVTPFHAYPETWTPDSVRVENYLDASFRESFVALNDSLGGSNPIWINEMGFATTPGKTERQQANWWARAVSTYLAEPAIEHIGIYEIKDLSPERDAIGDAANYHLGLTRTDRTKKLAFHTVDLLTDLLDTGTITVADGDVMVEVTSGAAGDLHRHLFVRPDGGQVLFLYDLESSPEVQVTLTDPASTAQLFALDGSSTATALEEGRKLSGVQLSPGEVLIFKFDP
jgi:polysaccharide biosynthesis protein PslG